MKKIYKNFMKTNRKDIKNLLSELKELCNHFYNDDYESYRIDLIIKTLTFYNWQFNKTLKANIPYKQFISIFN